MDFEEVSSAGALGRMNFEEVSSGGALRRMHCEEVSSGSAQNLQNQRLIKPLQVIIIPVSFY